VLAAPLPPLATQLVRADRTFRAAVAGWDDSRPLPQAAIDAAARQQLIELRLAGDARLHRVVIAGLPQRLRRDVVDDVQAHRELTGIAPAKKGPPIRLGAALPLARLRALYREGLQQSGVAWQLLAAVNYVESDFGRLREPSPSGALGPMQFMPATWKEYGRGDVHEPRAAILAAARFLHAAGAPGNAPAALHRYNPSAAYVNAVLRFASRIRRGRDGLAALYARRLFVHGAHGYRRLNGYS
jgi:soluble lytic murein transglycosylase-like protein